MLRIKYRRKPEGAFLSEISMVKMGLGQESHIKISSFEDEFCVEMDSHQDPIIVGLYDSSWGRIRELTL